MSKFYSSAASLYCALEIDALRSWPCKGGMLRHFDPERMSYTQVEKMVRLMPRDIPLSRFNETAQEVRFTRKWIVTIGVCPNGNPHRVTVYGT